jgi:hypothetical protein
VDGGGLQLWVQPSGARLWRVAYRFAAKQKLLALGVYPSVTLAKARQARDEAKRLLAQGLDPSDDRKQRAQAKANEPSPDFSHCRGCWLGPCRANRFSHLANTPGIGGGAKTCWHDNALRHHPATV